MQSALHKNRDILKYWIVRTTRYWSSMFTRRQLFIQFIIDSNDEKSRLSMTVIM